MAKRIAANTDKKGAYWEAPHMTLTADEAARAANQKANKRRQPNARMEDRGKLQKELERQLEENKKTPLSKRAVFIRGGGVDFC